MCYPEEFIEQFFSTYPELRKQYKPASMMDHGLHFYVYSFKIERTDISKLEKTSKLDIKHILVRMGYP